jgi:streptogramin lyase
MFQKLLSKWLNGSSRPASRKSPANRARLGVESLEERMVLSTVTYIDDNMGNLFSVNPLTGAATYKSTTSQVMYDIALSPAGKLYGVDGSSNLYSINPATGQTVEIGPLTHAGQQVFANGLEFRKDGALFASGYNAIYQVNPATGIATTVVTLSGQYQSAGDMAFDALGHLYLTTNNGTMIEATPSSHAWHVVGHAGSLGFSDFYGLTPGANGHFYGYRQSDQVYDINPATGRATFIANVHVQGNGHWLGAIYGAAFGTVVNTPPAPTYYIDDDWGNIFSVDPTTGNAVYRCTTNQIMNDIAFSPTGVLYGAGSDGSLYKININTGQTTWIGFLMAGGQSVYVNGLEFNKDGTLYASGYSTIYKVNPMSGACQAVVALAPQYQSAGDMAFDASGNVYLTTWNGSLIDASLTTHAWHVVGGSGHLQFGDFYGLSMAPNGQLYGYRSTGDVYQINPSTGAEKLIATVVDWNGPSVADIYGATEYPL